MRPQSQPKVDPLRGLASQGPSENGFRESPWLAGLLLGTIGLGWALRLWQYASGASLWLDELAVVRNIIHLPLKRLLWSPLEYGQMAPPGFLAVGRMLASVVEEQDWVFRLVPLFSSVLTLPFVYMMGRKTIGRFPAVVSTALVALSPAMISLGSVAKQYASDVFVCTALMYGAVRILSGEVKSHRELRRLGLIGGALLLFSFPAVLVAFAFSIAVAGKWWLEKGPSALRPIAAFGLPLAVCAGLTTAMALRARSAEMASYMAEFWATGFPPALLAFPAWLWQRLCHAYEATFIVPYPLPPGSPGLWPSVLLGLCVLGAVYLTRRGAIVAFVVLCPILVAVVAAGARLYPLAGRLAVFLAPTLAVLAIAGGLSLGELFAGKFASAKRLLCTVALVPTLVALLSAPPPYKIEDMRPLLQAVAKAWRPGDQVYSYYGANQSVDYYAERFGIESWHPGGCHRGNPRGYLKELDAFRGSPRVWILFTHVLPRYREGAAILGYLRTIGTELRAFSRPGPLMTSAFLFDLSDQDRLGRSTAQDYVLEASVVVDPRIDCGGGPAVEWRRPPVY